MTVTVSELRTKGQAALAAARRMAYVGTAAKNAALESVARALMEREHEILHANRQDLAAAEAEGLGAALLDRLLLTPERLAAMAADVRAVAALPDPVGETIDARVLPNGLQVARRRVPLGVIGAVYESRPNVTVDIAVLCLKSGNACLLRGGREALRSNGVLARLVAEAAAEAGLPEGAVQFIESTDRALVGELLRMREVVSLLVPRGGQELIRFVAENATMPVVTGGIGVCHTYVDASTDVEMAVRVIHNAKCRRPTICNALDTLLLHQGAAEPVLARLAPLWAEAGVEMRCDPRALATLRQLPVAGLRLVPASSDDFGQEFLALIAAVRVLDSLDEALEHIARYGSGHSEAIITSDYAAAQRFTAEVDAAAVYVNASTQFTDGGQFGLGAEVGISTQKMHARGPMGLRELTSYKWIVLGSGQTRP